MQNFQYIKLIGKEKNPQSFQWDQSLGMKKDLNIPPKDVSIAIEKLKFQIQNFYKIFKQVI